MVELATVQPGAKKFNVQNINDTWLGVLYLNNGSYTHAILKDVHPKEMANELLGASLAKALGLPVPRFFLAVAPSDVLPATKGPAIGDRRILFASERMGAPPLKQLWIGSHLPQAVIDTLVAWPSLPFSFGFDTWVANVDRNLGNMLYGGPGDIWLIDHGHILSGPFWVRDDLEAEAEYCNKMTMWLTPNLCTPHKKALIKGIDRLPDAIRKLDIKAIVETSKALAVLTSGDAKAMIEFLIARVENLSLIASKQAGLPRLC